MANLHHLPHASAVDAEMTPSAELPARSFSLPPLTHHPFALALVGSTAIAAVLLTGLLTAILEAPPIPGF